MNQNNNEDDYFLVKALNIEPDTKTFEHSRVNKGRVVKKILSTVEGEAMK